MSTYYSTDPQTVRLSVSAVVRRNAGAGELLLMQRSDNGHWGLPGGYVEPGESVREALEREIAEETGVRADVGRLLGVYSDPSTQVIAYPDGNRVHAINLCFEAVALSTGELGTPEETLATGYFAFEALPEPFVPIQHRRLRDALEASAEVRIR